MITPAESVTATYASLALPGEAANAVDQYEAVTTAFQSGAVPQSLSYDERGNLTSIGPMLAPGETRSFVYDLENRLISADIGGVSTALYDDDPSGRRVGKTVDGLETRYLHAGDMEIAEYDAGGALLRRYIPGGAIDERVAYIEGSAVTDPMFYYHADRLGSVAALSDGAGAAVDRYAYDPYGNETAGASDTGQPFRFTGRRYDPETGLYYYRARYYAPELGRFLQTDPVGYEDQYNLYTYVANDPVNATDPTGLQRGRVRRDPEPGSICNTPANNCNRSPASGHGAPVPSPPGDDDTSGGGSSSNGQRDEGSDRRQPSQSRNTTQSSFSNVIPSDVRSVIINPGNRRFGLTHIRREHSIRSRGFFRGKGAFFDELLLNEQAFSGKILAPALLNADSFERQVNGFVAIEASLGSLIGRTGTIAGGKDVTTDRVRIVLSPDPFKPTGGFRVHTAFPIAERRRITFQ